MDNFNFITNRLVTGGAVTCEEDADTLYENGITHIINNMQLETALGVIKHPNISYLFNGTPDDGLPKPVDWFQRPIEFALDALSRPHNIVFSHCAAGVNRGPSVAYAILMAQGINYNLAENMIRYARPIVKIGYKYDAIRAVIELGYMTDIFSTSAFGQIER